MYNLGVCHFLNQSYEQAILYFYEAIELNGDDGEAYYYLGICLIEIGKRQAGFRAWGQAMPLLNSSDTLLALAYMLEWNRICLDPIRTRTEGFRTSSRSKAYFLVFFRKHPSTSG